MLWHLIKFTGRLVVVIFATTIATGIFLVADHKYFGSWGDFKAGVVDAAEYLWHGDRL